MSLTASTRRNLYTGNGSTNIYDFTFKILTTAGLTVKVRNPETLELTTLTLDEDYTVTGAGSSSGGTVELLSQTVDWLDNDNNLEVDWKLLIEGATPQVQDTDIRNQGQYYPNLHEQAFDRMTMILQELAYKIRRAPLLSLFSSVADVVFPEPSPGKAVIWNATGDGLENSTTDINDVASAVDAAEAAQTAAEAAQELAEDAADIATAAAASFKPSPTDILGIGLEAQVSANSVSFILTQPDGTALDSSNAAKISFRKANNNGGFNSRTVPAPITITLSSGSTLGLKSSVPQRVYIYLIDNAGTVEMAASASLFREDKRHNTTAEGGAGAADSGSVLYSTTARTDVPIRLIGMATFTITAGTWASPGRINLVNYSLAAKEPCLAVAGGAQPTGTLGASYNAMVIGNVVKDTHNLYNVSTGEFTFKQDGFYEMFCQTRLDHASTTVNGIYSGQIQLQSNAVKGGTFIQPFKATGVTEPVMIQCHALFEATVGQVASFKTYTDGGTPTYANDSGGVNVMWVRRVADLVD